MPDETAPLPAPSLYEKLRQRRGLMQFIKFGIVGFSGLAINLVLFTILQQAVPHHDQALQYYSIFSISFLGGGVSNYFLNRKWTFRSDAHAGREGAQFITVSVIALLFSYLISFLVSPHLGHGHRTWFIATCGAILVNFFVNKYWTFRGR
jgi:putative flippase GtrA